MGPRFSATLAILLLTAGCQSTPETSTTGGVSATSQSGTDAGSSQVKIAKDPKQSGFLPQDVYAKLKPAPDREGVMVYVDMSANYRPFTKIMFEPTEVYLVPNPEYKGMPSDALKRMTGDFQRSFREALSPGYVIVNQPGPDVLTVRSAITGVQPTAPERGVTDYIPIKALFNVARKAAGAAPQVAEMSAELEVLSPTGAVVGAATATRKGEKHLSQGEQITWNDMQSISDYWAKNFRQRLDELRGMSSGQ